MLAVSTLAAACHSEGDPANSPLPGGASRAAWEGVKNDETLHVTGTEPFWSGKARGGTLTWTTPEDLEGTEIAVTRFAGRGGMGLSGKLDGKGFELAVSEGTCSDGMSDRTYPFTVTVLMGDQTLRGCGWSDSRRYTGAPKD